MVKSFSQLNQHTDLPTAASTPRELLAVFYRQNNLEPDGGVNSASVKIQVSKGFSFFIPNFPSRRKAIIKHDIHHLVTGYSAGSILGESEISAWELASGCKVYWMAFLIDASGMMLGLLINPKRVLMAFARGRRTRNLYHDLMTDEEALGIPVSSLKTELGLDKHPADRSVSVMDVVWFLVCIFLGGIYSLLSLILLPLVVLYSIYEFARNQEK